MRFGIGMNTDHTLEEVGQQFPVTRERIRQIEAKVLTDVARAASPGDWRARRTSTRAGRGRCAVFWISRTAPLLKPLGASVRLGRLMEFDDARLANQGRQSGPLCASR